MKIFPIILGVLSVCINVSFADMRTWTDTTGRKLEAEFISSDGKAVVVKLANGKETKIPLMQLSEEDREFVKNEANAGGEASATSSSGNFDQPWPKFSKDPGNYEVEIIQEGPDEYIYETPHFRYISDAKLAKSLVKTVSQMFEATYEANKVLPLNNMPWQVKDTKFVARLFEKKSDYHKSGGPGTSAGVFVSGGEYGPLGVVMVPFESLGVKPMGSSYIIDRNQDTTTLIHEITHQMMSREVKQASWFIEGSAEYVAHTPYKNGRFNFNNNKSSILEKVTAFGKKGTTGRALGKDIAAPSLKRYMTMPYGEFVGANGMLHYGLAPLLAYYFYHADGEGDAARIKAYVKALQEGKKEDEAAELLLDGRTYDELAKEVTTFWRRSGVTINFADSE